MATSIWGTSERRHASKDSGLTTPVVPKIDTPPTMPSFAFMVFLAMFAPSGALIMTSTPFPAGRTSLTASVIMLLGTGLIAPSPMGTCKPGFGDFADAYAAFDGDFAVVG